MAVSYLLARPAEEAASDVPLLTMVTFLPLLGALVIALPSSSPAQLDSLGRARNIPAP